MYLSRKNKRSSFIGRQWHAPHVWPWVEMCTANVHCILVGQALNLELAIFNVGDKGRYVRDLYMIEWQADLALTLLSSGDDGLLTRLGLAVLVVGSWYGTRNSTMGRVARGRR